MVTMFIMAISTATYAVTKVLVPVPSLIVTIAPACFVLGFPGEK